MHLSQLAHTPHHPFWTQPPTHTHTHTHTWQVVHTLTAHAVDSSLCEGHTIVRVTIIYCCGHGNVFTVAGCGPIALQPCQLRIPLPTARPNPLRSPLHCLTPSLTPPPHPLTLHQPTPLPHPSSTTSHPYFSLLCLLHSTRCGHQLLLWRNDEVLLSSSPGGWAGSSIFTIMFN